ncbi:hypothetical protein [Mesorhizobium sp.]|uniref:hypothetical protein n=1 Tax=Mesorhizobium sp. TaxID=1871066 RepID=UPI0025DE745D|nr:hypothetical protein [Mesorhizobium sp.]
MRRNDVADDLKDIAFEFLYFFARFEFALKVNGYLKKSDAGQPAEASWKLFREQWEGNYQITDAAASLIAANPKKQIVGAGGTLDFSPVAFADDSSTLARVTTLCQTVRNNLFHGGKSSPDGWDGPERTKMLLSLVLVILGELAATCDLNHDYTGYY